VDSLERMILMSPASPALEEQVRHFLMGHELTNANLLWVLRDEGEVEVLIDDEGGVGAAALLVRQPPGEWERPGFIRFRRLWLEARDSERAASLLALVPEGETFYVRIHREWLRGVFSRRYRLEPCFELVYFRADGPRFRPRLACEVEHEKELGPGVMGLLTGSGRTEKAAGRLAERCGGAYVARLWGEPVGVCCVNRKTEHLCEILSVFVKEEVRRGGVGQSLVSAATQAVLAEGRVPTYCTRDDNFASQALVGSLGFERYQKVLYAVAHPRGGKRG